jgi:hypothetical protein
MRALALLATLALALGAQTPDPTPTAKPEAGILNPIVLEVLRSYPADGTHAYYWPKSGGWKGCTKDLKYCGELLAAGDPKGRAYCCGLTFEVFFDAWMLWCRRNKHEESVAGLDVKAMKRVQSEWFGSKEDPTCLQTAFVANGLGHVVAKWEEATAGDFVQLWRNNGSGHSVVFLSWIKERESIVGLRYWSTQPSTKGIGEREERFGAE